MRRRGGCWIWKEGCGWLGWIGRDGGGEMDGWMEGGREGLCSAVQCVRLVRRCGVVG
jgi:hypothetical protein